MARDQRRLAAIVNSPGRYLVRAFACGFQLLATVVLSGCFTTNHLAIYPQGWAQPKEVAAETCPDIAGRYLNSSGTRSPDWGSNMHYFCVTAAQKSPNWICKDDLAGNLLDDLAFRTVRAIEIRQPDPATLLISVADDPSIQPRTLSRSHRDFECGVDGFTISKWGSDMNGASSVLSLLVLHVGVASSSRSFRPLSDGSLLMEVTNELHMTQELISGSIKGQGFVRWDRDPGGNVPEPDLPKEGDDGKQGTRR
jgi:hypothetical protein